MASYRGKELKQVIDPTLAKAFTHPLRGHVWVTLFEQGEVSPTEIANELELEVSEVSYHFRELSRRGLIELVRTAQRRGFEEHFYAPVAPAIFFDDEEWMKLPAGLRSRLSADLVKQIAEQLIDALRAESLDARDRHLSQSWLIVDERGWREIARMLASVLERMTKIRERSARRREQSGEKGIPVSLVLAAFETAGGVARRQGKKTESL